MADFRATFERETGVTRAAGRDAQTMFAKFAAEYAELPLYGRIAIAVSGDAEVAGLLDVAESGQARPVLLFAAVHDLVLRRPELPLARWYPSVTGGPVPPDDPWPTFRATCLGQADELRRVISSRSTQTNEVNRVAYVAPLLAAATADEAATPVSLVELGPSAGLLLGLDRYRIEVGAEVAGDPASPVRCSTERRGGRAPALVPFPPAPPIVARVGLDRHPVALDDIDGVQWLEACLWPDVPGRLDRFRAAVALLRPDPPELVAGEMVDDLPALLSGLTSDAHLVVFHCWALSYVERARRSGVVAALEAVAADGRPVSWLSAEPPGCVPQVPAIPGVSEGGETVLGLRRWRAGRELPPVAAGHAHPHATWLTWTDRGEP